MYGTSYFVDKVMAYDKLKQFNSKYSRAYRFLILTNEEHEVYLFFL